MTALSVFSFSSTPVRMFSDARGEMWFLAKDVCEILGYRSSSDALKKHCRARGVAKYHTPTAKGKQMLSYINQGNLYRLIVRSRKAEAEKFEAWVMDEVLPYIRKSGLGELNKEVVLENAERLLLNLQSTRFALSQAEFAAQLLKAQLVPNIHDI